MNRTIDFKWQSWMKGDLRKPCFVGIMNSSAAAGIHRETSTQVGRVFKKRKKRVSKAAYRPNQIYANDAASHLILFPGLRWFSR